MFVKKNVILSRWWWRHELLSTLEVSLVSHDASSVFLVISPSSSTRETFSKSVGSVIMWLGMICNPWAFGPCFEVSEMFSFSGVKSFACFSNVAPRTIGNKDQRSFFSFYYVLFWLRPFNICNYGRPSKILIITSIWDKCECF